MTIADQLTDINNSKQAIKTAIEAKGVTVGIAPLNQYADKIALISGGGLPPSITPVLAAGDTFYFKADFQVTNMVDYIDPNFSGVIVGQPAQPVVIDNATGLINTPGLTPGTYTLQITVQEFGQGVSAIAERVFTLNSSTFRYWRFRNIVGSSATGPGLVNWRLYTDSGQTGTALPSNMTSSTAPTPYVVTSTYSFSATYADWKAFDSDVNSFWWLLSHSPAQVLNDWIQIDLGSEVNIKSMRFRPQPTYAFNSFDIVASNTGAFAGEEALIGSFSAPIGGIDYNVG